MPPTWLQTARTLLLGGALICAACGDDLRPGIVEPEVEPKGQGSPPSSALLINEVYARGAGPDWIEIYNQSDVEIDLCNFFVTDALDRLDHYLPLGGTPPPGECSPKYLGPRAYYIVIADDKNEEGGEHAPFKLGVADEVHIVDQNGDSVDSLIYLLPPDSEDMSLARLPNAEGLFWVSPSSQGAFNPGEPPITSDSELGEEL